MIDSIFGRRIGDRFTLMGWTRGVGELISYVHGNWFIRAVRKEEID